MTTHLELLFHRRGLRLRLLRALLQHPQLSLQLLNKVLLRKRVRWGGWRGGGSV